MLMKNTPPTILFIDPTAKPIGCYKISQVPINFQEKVKAYLDRDMKL